MTEPTTGATDGFDEVIDPVDGTRWLVDVAFLRSNWTCIWDRGCAGIQREPDPDAQLGCCSVGAQMIDEDEAMRIAGLGLSLDESIFEHAAAAFEGGLFRDEKRNNTRVVNGACIFLNRPGFAGGEGCALHLAALEDEIDPLEYKPTICWQAPLVVDDLDNGTRRLRPWTRDDWDGGAEDMGWCCPEREPADGLATAYVGDEPVADSLHAELRAITGPEVAVELQRRYGAT